MANRRYIDFPIASSVGDSDIILIWQSGANKQTTKATFLSGLPENLDELNDVAISGLTNGQILRYDSVTGKWENTDQGNLDLNDLNDVSIVSPSNGQVLVYNSSTSKWENSSGGYVPYVGAVTTVDLGAQTIQAGSFVKVGGTSAQFLKADGSVDSNTYGTGTVTSVGLTMPTAFNVANSPVTTAGTLAVTGAGNASQYIAGDGTLVTFPSLTGYVPYTGANQTVNLNTQQLQAGHTTLTTNGSTETLTINHTSGSGKAINVTKGGNGEGLYINKTSGSGNAATIVGTLEATTLVKTGGTSSQFLKADGSVDSSTYGTGTVTSVGLSSATSGVTIGSTPITTSGTITLAIATASGSQNGLLSSTDWTTFNNKQNALTNPVTGTGTTNYLPKFTGASTIGNSQVFDNGTTVGIGIITPNSNPRLHVYKAGGNFDTIVADGDAGTNTGFGIYEAGNQKYAIYNNGSAGIDSFNIYNTATGSNSLTIYTSGNVGINSASDNGARLQVSGAVTTMATITSSGTASGLQLTNTGSTASSWIIQSDGGAVAGQAALRFYSLTASAYRMSIDGSGNVGINQTNPTGRLEVVPANAGGNEGIFVNQLGSNQATIRFKSAHSSGSDYRIGASILVGSAFEIYSVNAAATRFAVTSGGNVLIGTTTDNGNKLNVEGNTKIKDARIITNFDNVLNGGSVTINTQGGGFGGFMIISSTLVVDPNFRTITTYSYFGRGTGLTVSQIATANGLGGGQSFSVQSGGSEIIQVNNTSGSTCKIIITLFGSVSP